MASILSWKFVLVILTVVLVNATAIGVCLTLGLPSPASGQINPKFELIVIMCYWILDPIELMSYAPYSYSKIGVAIVLVLEAVVIHLSVGCLSCKWKGKPLELRNLFRFRPEELRFSVRHLMVFMTLVCVIGGIYAGWMSWQRRSALHRAALWEMGIEFPNDLGYDYTGHYEYDGDGKKVWFDAARYRRWRSVRGESPTWDFPPQLLRIRNVTLLRIERATHLPPAIATFADVQLLSILHGYDESGGRLTTLPPEIGNLSNLRFLDLRSNALTALPPEIGRLTKLEMLDLRGNPITDSVVEQLAPLKNLRILFREETEMTEAGIAKLRQTLPNCNVE